MINKSSSKKRFLTKDFFNDIIQNSLKEEDYLYDDDDYPEESYPFPPHSLNKTNEWLTKSYRRNYNSRYNIIPNIPNYLRFEDALHSISNPYSNSDLYNNISPHYNHSYINPNFTNFYSPHYNNSYESNFHNFPRSNLNSYQFYQSHPQFTHPQFTPYTNNYSHNYYPHFNHYQQSYPYVEMVPQHSNRFQQHIFHPNYQSPLSNISHYPEFITDYHYQDNDNIKNTNTTSDVISIHDINLLNLNKDKEPSRFKQLKNLLFSKKNKHIAKVEDYDIDLLDSLPQDTNNKYESRYNRYDRRLTRIKERYVTKQSKLKQNPNVYLADY